jgi:Protein of unknown function (DUF2975)
MVKLPWLVVPLRILLVLAFLFLVAMQLFAVPGDIFDDLRRAPDAGHVFIPMLVVAELVIVCFQVVIVCTWVLLGMVKKDRIFSEASLRWVNAIVLAFVAAWLAWTAFATYLSAYIYFTPEIRDPGIPVALFGIVLLGAVFVLLVVVLRALLRQATTLRTEMEAVI